MKERSEINLTLEDHKKAFTEVSFLLEIFVNTIMNLVGSGAPTVGRNAGRRMARKLPIHLDNPTLDEVLAAIAEHFQNGFEIKYTVDGSGADLEFGRCGIREVCTERGQEIGSEICKVCHWYLGGVVNEILRKPIRTTIGTVGTSQCKIRLDTQ